VTTELTLLSRVSYCGQEIAGPRMRGLLALLAIRRDYAERIASADVTLGLSHPAFAAMIESSPVLAGRGREMLDQRERALGDAIAAETGVDDVQQPIVAAQLASVHRVLYAEGSRRSLAGERRDHICAVLAAAARRAFDLPEPSLGGYGIRPGPPGTVSAGPAATPAGSAR
jgi:hypothetical protein